MYSKQKQFKKNSFNIEIDTVINMSYLNKGKPQKIPKEYEENKTIYVREQWE